ncbi:endo-1-3(4)-beta-glucanase [Penicillium macrosclerotiorum]|uniref:endo-1-3(4)-beta-glucanase n=1 Tax=Penicillium macrosclerotiorum TaxID=303699 RepID=UPI002547F1F4|nr:endo-1-3(4)-beta-glucanase [Penicillium macrosclerotiorum]KAJ5668682.1 endo-1-3(4)-beta-glucanase [Penicillium macrosclerotiorum]
MVSSSLSLSAGSLFLLWLASPTAATSDSYGLVENWHGKSFLDYFNFYTGSDPTNGFVTYVDQSSAESAGLVKVTDSGSVYIGVDHTTTLSTTGKGRDSVRIGSKKYYDHSLIIADIAHMPGSICGSWPAFWSVGKEWPADGEIDIIEGVNLQDHNEIVMHTAGTCSITDTGMTGAVNATGCGEDLGTVGCVIEGDTGSYGTSFNKQGGGVYAMQWTEQFVKIWFFPRSSIPKSISSGSPDVSQFGTPMALVQDGCDVASSFKSQSFVFDVTFCGDWAGGVFGTSGCPMSSSDPSQSCINYVAKNPAKFEQTYWEINSVKIYQTGVETDSTSSSTHAVASTHATVVEATKATQAVAETTAKATIAAAETSAAVVESAASGGWSNADTSSASSANTVGVVGELTGLSDATSTAVASSSKTTRFVTKFVTETTTLCPVAQASASLASSSNGVETPAVVQTTESVQSAAPIATDAAKEAQTPVQQPSAATSEAVNSQVPSQVPTGADAVSTNAPQTAASSDTTLPTIIMAPGVNIGSSSLLPSPHGTQTSKALIPAATGASAASSSSGGTSQGSSTTAVSPVFTGAAERASVKFSTIIAAFVLALMA